MSRSRRSDKSDIDTKVYSDALYRRFNALGLYNLLYKKLLYNRCIGRYTSYTGHTPCPARPVAYTASTAAVYYTVYSVYSIQLYTPPLWTRTLIFVDRDVP